MRPPLPLLVLYREKFAEKKPYYQHPTSIHVPVEESSTISTADTRYRGRACYGFLTFSAIRYIC
jgi:hypothetical protein